MNKTIKQVAEEHCPMRPDADDFTYPGSAVIIISQAAFIAGATWMEGQSAEEVKRLKELLQRAKTILQQQINSAPTSEYRNLLCDFNIELHNALK